MLMDAMESRFSVEVWLSRETIFTNPARFSVLHRRAARAEFAGEFLFD
jgi:hypothetical protein